MSIEDFLDRKFANAYILEHHRFSRVTGDLFGKTKQIFDAFSLELLASEQLRASLAASLGNEPVSKTLAERWALFLRSRTNIMEFWSGLCSSMVAVVALGVTLFTLVSSTTGKPPVLEVMLTFLLGTALFVALKFLIERRLFWYKFITAHLEAIAKVGSNPALNTDALQAAKSCQPRVK